MRATWIGCAAVLSAAVVNANVVLNEDFANLNNWKDLSTAVTWGGNTTPTSAFTTAGGQVALTSAALATGGNYVNADSLKTFTTIDHQFASPIDRLNNTVTVDFRARWSATGSNESGRFNVVFVHDYPTGGLDTTLNAKYNSDFNGAPWGRPAYQVRIRSGGTTLLQYGGGLDPEGEFEVYSTSGNPQWWLPGFVSAPGGGSPGTSTAKGWTQSAGVLANTAFRNYRYVITPTEQQIWVDDNDDTLFQLSELKATQDLTADAANPGFFNVFGSLEGIRLYWRGASNYNTFVDSLSVTVTPIPEPTTLGTIALAGLLLGRRRRR